MISIAITYDIGDYMNLVLADNYWAGLLTPEIIVIMLTQRISYLPIYKNYSANYKNFPGASVKFQEISRSCRHPDITGKIT